MPSLLRLRPRPSTAAAATEVPDAELVARARGDPQAFATLYDRYQGPIYRYCLRQLPDREAAEDATSAVFVKALAGLASYRDDSFRGWLFTIAFHEVADRWRAGRPDSGLPAAMELADPAATPEELTLAAESARSVRTLVAQLPATERRVVNLRLAGLTDGEIAAALGLSHGNVRVIQHRAIRRLRALRAVAVPAEEGAHG
jgi:RNA polymerase sigma-70 factor (ECF subfamily)